MNYFYQKDNIVFLERSYLQLLHQFDLIVDGSSGGLILGSSHAEGGIKLIRQYSSTVNEYCIIAEIEGWEFLMNTFAESEYGEELEKVNKDYNSKEAFESYEPPKDINVIDARPIEILGQKVDKFIITSLLPQRVINRHSTKKCLDRLYTINKQTWIR